MEATDEILEHFPFDVSVAESEYMAHPLVKATDSFLRKQVAAQRADDAAPISSVLFVSLSGGECNAFDVLLVNSNCNKSSFDWIVRCGLHGAVQDSYNSAGRIFSKQTASHPYSRYSGHTVTLIHSVVRVVHLCTRV